MQKIQFDYFTGMEAEQYSFYRVPKVLFTESCFKTLSCEAKVLYGLMLDRMSLSIKNRWLDSEDRVYIIFTVEEIAELMNCGTQKAVKLVKELDSSNGIGLIEKKRLGLGKPNVIYVKNFMIREVPDQKPTGNCADLQSEQEDHKKIADLQSKQKRHEECADLQQEAENKGKTGISLNCENHHSGVVKTTIQDYGESQFQNSENHNSRMVETTNPEFPESQFQNSENHHSRIVEITNPEYPKSQSNNTDINKTDISETEINQSYPIISGNLKKKRDVMEEMRTYREVIHENIDYKDQVLALYNYINSLKKFGYKNRRSILSKEIFQKEKLKRLEKEKEFILIKQNSNIKEFDSLLSQFSDLSGIKLFDIETNILLLSPAQALDTLSQIEIKINYESDESLLKLNKLENNFTGIKKLNKLDKVLSKEKFKQYKKKYIRKLTTLI